MALTPAATTTPAGAAARFTVALGLAFSCAFPAHAEAGRPDGGASAAPAPSASAEGALVVAEPPYKLGERQRADGAVVASVDDEAISRWNVGGSSNPACASNRIGFHPAPRVKVDTLVSRGRLPARSGAKGVLSELAILSQTRNRGYWPFRLCFEAGLRQNGELAGKTQVRIVIGPDGRVARSRVDSTELRDGDGEVSSCLATQARALRFSPAPRRRVEVGLTVDLNPGDAPLPDGARGPSHGRTYPPPDPGPGKLDVPATLSELQALLPRISACYAAARAKDASLWGRVALQIDASESGKIVRVAEFDTRFPAREVVGCIVGNVLGAEVPPARGGKVRFVWGLRLGAPPALELALNPLPASGAKTSVADSPSPRVRLGP